MIAPDFASWSQASGGTTLYKAYAVIDGGDAVVSIAVNDPGIDRPVIWALFWTYWNVTPTGGNLLVEFDTSGIHWNTPINRADGGHIEWNYGLYGDNNDAVTVTLEQGTTPAQVGRIIVVYSHEAVS